MAKNPYILSLNELGQSIWYDNLSRDVLGSGELQTLIDAGVSGLTSNPTIFKTSIADSSDYDEEMLKPTLSSLSNDDLCEELMIQDVARAADLLKPIYTETNGGDGYASIEVSPLLAAETSQTIEAGKRIWKKLNRPNIMIKVPATPQGIPAIQALLEEGINVNVTLIFSTPVYEQVMEAYLKGLESRAAKGGDISKLSSVASFFVSRVDAIAEKKIAQLIADGKAAATDKDKYLGKIGVANCRVAYARHLEIFGSPRFKALKEKGAMVQRALWASTGTKNPAFKPVMYIEELAGRDTVNTLPPATLKALLNGADVKPRLHEGAAEAKALIDSADKLGADVAALLVQLQTEGVASFTKSYQDLIDSIDAKRKKL